MSPLVSVIIPSWNAERTIGYTLESIFRQTLQDIEVIVVDDASDDGTRDVLKGFIHYGLKCLVNKERRGPGVCRNLGIQAASGKYVAFVDADDAIASEYLETLVRCLMNLGPRSVVASNIWVCRSSDDEMLPSFTLFEERGLRLPSMIPCRVSLSKLIEHNVDIKPMICRKELIETNVRFWEQTMGEEWLPFLIELSCAGFNFFLVNEPLYYYRVHESNISRKHETVIRELISVERLLITCEMDEATKLALERYRRFLRARAPWVALRSGRLKEFVNGLIRYPMAMSFVIFKLQTWLRRRLM